MVWSLTIVSLWNFLRAPDSNEADETESKNNSFHRIYSDGASDVSDASDEESELNTSTRSIGSGHSERRPYCSANSLNATFVSKAPSVVSTSTYASKKPYRGSMGNLLQTNRFDSGSIRRFDRTSHLDLTKDLYFGNQSIYSSAAASTYNNPFDNRLQSPSTYAGSVNRLDIRDATTYVDPFRSASRLSMNDIPDEFESGITQLSISDVAKNRENYCNSKCNQPNDSVASFAIRQRRPLLLPARLSYHENNQHDATVAANQSSWLAGGYWNNTSSPQKRQDYAA